jgi:secondary thiamine-phosphate synthase enzyme
MKQFTVKLKSKPRGFHLITEEIECLLPELPDVGLLHIFILHTSASLAINENADPSVREDLEYVFNKLVPENDSGYTHIYEGPDDMPAHVKAMLNQTSLTIPVSGGKLALGTWQGIYLCEHRNHASSRYLRITVQM